MCGYRIPICSFHLLRMLKTPFVLPPSPPSHLVHRNIQPVITAMLDAAGSAWSDMPEATTALTVSPRAYANLAVAPPPLAHRTLPQ
jgi:hypothetical protein